MNCKLPVIKGRHPHLICKLRSQAFGPFYETHLLPERLADTLLGPQAHARCLEVDQRRNLADWQAVGVDVVHCTLARLNTRTVASGWPRNPPTTSFPQPRREP